LIIKNNSTRLLLTLLFLLILPFVQKQWFNLYLFNNNEISFYSILYYFSGTICPSLISLNSLNNYTYYKFYDNKIYSKKTIKGKALFLLVAINLIFFSYLIVDYVYINFDLLSNLFFKGINLQQLDIVQLSLFMFLIAILLIIEPSRLLIKKFILINFIFISFCIWYTQVNNIDIGNQFHIYKYFGLNDINLINIFILVSIEVCYFTWSFLSYKTNLSDWTVKTPLKRDIIPIVNIFIFYFFIIIYYTIII